MDNTNNRNLSEEEINLLNKEIKRATGKHKQFAKKILKFGWLIPLVLCGITMLSSNAAKVYISLAWIGIGFIVNIWIWMEDLLKTKKYINPIKEAILTNSRSDVNSILKELSPFVKKTTREDLEKIESLLGTILPNCYKQTIMNYPFPKNSLADDYFLPYDTELIIKNNESSFLKVIKTPEIKPFCIGNDGSEERYYLDLNCEETKVFVYSLETGKSEIYTTTWADYIKRVEEFIKETEEDEKKPITRQSSGLFPPQNSVGKSR